MIKITIWYFYVIVFCVLHLAISSRIFLIWESRLSNTTFSDRELELKTPICTSTLTFGKWQYVTSTIIEIQNWQLSVFFFFLCQILISLLKHKYKTLILNNFCLVMNCQSWNYYFEFVLYFKKYEHTFSVKMT